MLDNLENKLVSLKSFLYICGIKKLKTHNMTNEDEKLESMNNGDLAMEFLKRCQKCRENGVPNDMAILAALHDLADWKDAHPSERFVTLDKVYRYLVERCFFTEAEAKEVLEGLKEPDYNET